MANDLNGWSPGTETKDELRRQLAAANERVAKLEAALCCDTPYRDQASELAKLRAQMVELRAAWFRVVTCDGFNGATEAEISDGDMAIFTRILGGA